MIYKYRGFSSPYKYDVFKKAELYFASPSEFNDPFESKPQLIGLDTLKERQKFVDGYINRELKGIGFKKKQALKKQFLTRLSNKEHVKKDLYALLNSYGIYSTAKKWNQCLMWSHYSESHKGFCIGFEFDNDFDDDAGMAHEVKYAEDYPKVHPDVFGDKNDENNFNLLEATLATKSIDWEYEEEIRFIKLARDGGSGIYKFRESKVKEVIIGAYASNQNKKELIEVIEKHMPWVDIFQALLSESKYELIRERLKLTKR